jgi:hypothetical protein
MSFSTVGIWFAVFVFGGVIVLAIFDALLGKRIWGRVESIEIFLRKSGRVGNYAGRIMVRVQQDGKEVLASFETSYGYFSQDLVDDRMKKDGFVPGSLIKIRRSALRF